MWGSIISPMDGNDGSGRVPASIFKDEYGADPMVRSKGCRLCVLRASLAQSRSLAHMIA